MAILPPMDEDPTLEAMHKLIEEADAAKEKRGYLGASTLGHECERSVWYTYNGYRGAPIEYKGLYAIEDGFRSEDLIASRLRLVPGVELATLDDEGNQFGFSKFDNKFQGHIDGFIRGILQAPKTAHIWENKSVNEKKFKELKSLKDKFGEKNALKEWDFTYFVQAQIYMGEFGLDRHYLTVCTPGGRDVISCRTEFQRVVYDAMIVKAQRVITAKEPPARISTRPEVLVCKWCRHHDTCWKGAADEKPQTLFNSQG